MPMPFHNFPGSNSGIPNASRTEAEGFSPAPIPPGAADDFDVSGQVLPPELTEEDQVESSKPRPGINNRYIVHFLVKSTIKLVFIPDFMLGPCPPP